MSEKSCVVCSESFPSNHCLKLPNGFLCLKCFENLLSVYGDDFGWIPKDYAFDYVNEMGWSCGY